MKKQLLLLLACVLAIGIQSASASTFYSKVTATVSSGEGYVYVANADKTSVTDDEINQTSHSATYSGQGLGTTGRGEPTHTFTMYAKGAEGYSFKQWNDGNQTNPRTVSFTVSSTSSGSPTTKEYSAIFEGSAFAVKSEDLGLGVVAIDKPIVNIGDVVTITATPIKPVGNGELWSTTTPSKSIHFTGWYNKAGELVSTDNPYTHTVTAEDVFTAHFEREYTIKVDENNNIYGYYRLQSCLSNNPSNGEIGKYYLCITGDFTPGLSVSDRYVMGAVELNQYPYDFNGIQNSSYALSIAPYADCGSILYITGKAKANVHTNVASRTTVADDINAEAQGVTVKKITGNETLNLKSAATQGYYIIFSGNSASLQVNYFHHMWVTTDKPGNAIFSYTGDFDVQPVDLEHIDTNYFGPNPSADMEFDGSYWTTFYTSFPYECYEPDGVEAYVIKSGGNSENIGAYLVLTRLEDGIVPAATPVILKCKSTHPKENRLIPLMPDDARIAAAAELCEGNLLTGNYGLWTGYSNSEKDLMSRTATYSGRQTYDHATMRVFGANSAGTLGFYRMAANADGSAPELVPNRAYLTDAALASVGITTEAAARGIRMRFDSDLSGVNDVEVFPTPGQEIIYDLFGRRVEKMIPGNLYIVNGRKVLCRQ